MTEMEPTLETVESFRIPWKGGTLYVRPIPDWYPDGSLVPRTAWVVDFMVPERDIMQQSLLAYQKAKPARQELEALAIQAAELGPGSLPKPFGQAPIGDDDHSQLRKKVELISHSFQSAVDRVHRAAQSDEQWAAEAIAVAVFESTAWLRSLDEVMTRVWQDKIKAADKEALSKEVDDHVATNPSVVPLIQEEFDARRRSKAPYEDWSIALIGRGRSIPRRELDGFRWLANVLLHLGPLSVGELYQWRPGARPIWRWRQPDEFMSGRWKRDRQGLRKSFEETLSGKAILGSLSFAEVLIEMEYMILGILSENRAN